MQQKLFNMKFEIRKGILSQSNINPAQIKKKKKIKKNWFNDFDLSTIQYKW